MANWVDQELAVFGPAEDMGRFCALALTGNFRRDHTLDDEPTFRFDLACPILPGDAEACIEEHTAAVLFRCLRAQAFLRVEMQSSWGLPRAEFLSLARVQRGRDTRHDRHEPALPERGRRAHVREGAKTREGARAERADGEGAESRGPLPPWRLLTRRH